MKTKESNVVQGAYEYEDAIQFIYVWVVCYISKFKVYANVFPFWLSKVSNTGSYKYPLSPYIFPLVQITHSMAI